jgi:hypothetical protein
MEKLTFRKLCELMFINYCETIDLENDSEQLEDFKKFQRCKDMEDIVSVLTDIGSDNPCEDMIRVISEYWKMPINTLNLY